jgi:hypothetical protein
VGFVEHHVVPERPFAVDGIALGHERAGGSLDEAVRGDDELRA